MINNYLSDYSAFMTLGEFDQAALSAYEIFKELIEEGMLLDELIDEDYVTATLKHDYDGYLLDDYALESLVELLAIYGEQDDVEFEVEATTKKYAMVRYGLNLVEGTKNRIQPNFTFKGIEEAQVFFDIHIAMAIDELSDNGLIQQIGVTNLGDREDVIDTLNLQEDVEFETIIDNIPETSESVIVYTYRDLETGVIVYSEIFALYELGEFSLED